MKVQLLQLSIPIVGVETPLLIIHFHSISFTGRYFAKRFFLNESSLFHQSWDPLSWNVDSHVNMKKRKSMNSEMGERTWQGIKLMERPKLLITFSKVKRRCQKLLSLPSCSKKHEGAYAAQTDTRTSIPNENTDVTFDDSANALVRINEVPHPDTFSAPRSSHRRNKTRDSFQGSIESLDSLVESCWDPEDDSSQCTQVTSNPKNHVDFFVQHLGFLCIQTQPRQVQVVY